jgi:hypothetical protein
LSTFPIMIKPRNASSKKPPSNTNNSNILSSPIL